MSSSSPPPGSITPRIIIHGGAGAITPTNLPPPLYLAHRAALLSILSSTSTLLAQPTTTALEAATHAVALLELNPLYNAGRGAVFTTTGRIEHEASVMVSTAHPGVAFPDLSAGSIATSSLRKIASSTMRTSQVKHPILLAKTMLLKGEEPNWGGAQGHVQICGETAEGLAREWGLEMVRPSWHWERKRWEQHRRGRGLGTSDGEWRREREGVDREAGFEEEDQGRGQEGKEGDEGMEGWDGIERLRYGSREATEDCGYAEVGEGWNGEDYLPQGTVGAVVLDRFGTICVATSTGGMTNKLPGRIGDTPTIGAGFWAESWHGDGAVMFGDSDSSQGALSPLGKLIQGHWVDVLRDWLPEWMLPSPTATYLPLTNADVKEAKQKGPLRAVGMSGTGNGDSYLKLCCARTVAAMTRFSSPSPSLQTAVSKMAGPDGLLQESAEDRWGKTGEGEGGIIGIELVGGIGKVVSDFNCRGMFRAWVDDDGQGQMMVFKDDYEKGE
ncbi:Isoaspartyl peptidase [Elsinoe australis]|uniref:Isoaspartyl peptidase n=1 Tax=Elsinoe australis TaxID=40998 RepID=A0A2P7YDT8_9PEZI|nr:Isoaspartyl peptidase [Elsinoe australis]